MRQRIPTRVIHEMFRKAAGSGPNGRMAPAVFAAIIGLLCSAPQRPGLQAAANPSAKSTATSVAAKPISLSETLGVHFILGSSSSVLIERDGKTYLVDLAERTIKMEDPLVASAAAPSPGPESSHSSPRTDQLGAQVFGKNCAQCHGAEGKGVGAKQTPDFTSPAIQASLSGAAVIKIVRVGKPGTEMPAWRGKLSEAEINAVAAYVKSLGGSYRNAPASAGGEAKQNAKVYQPADDYLFSLPTGRRLDRHGFYLNFTHRFAYTPAFSRTGSDTLFGLDDFAIASFGLRYGVTDKLSVSAYRSPSIIGRPIELMIAYNFWDEHDGAAVNVSARLSEDGQNSFSKNFTTNLEAIISRSFTHRAQLYFVPTISFQNRELISKPGQLASTPPDLPGFNTFSLGVGGALDIRPTVALVAEVMPTLVNGSEIGIHRPAFSFGIQKRVFRHAFTLGFSNSPGTVVAQRAGTRATFVGSPSADTPGGLFIGFDLMRQIY
jgi:mono/diheme cytochrome c family protein